MKTILCLFAVCSIAFAQNDASTVGTPTYGAAKFSSGLTAVSDSNYLVTPAGLSTTLAAGSSCSVDFWLKTSSSAVQAAITTSASSLWWIGVISNNNAFNAFAGTSTKTATGINNGSFHHLASEINAGTGTTYFDGVSIGTGTGDCNTLFTAASTLRIGSYTLPSGAWGGSLDEIAFWTIAKYTSNFTPPSAPYVGNESGLVALYHLNGNALDSATGPGSLIAPNDAGIIYSPYNWTSNSSNAVTINSGAYFKTIFDGTSVRLRTNTEANTGYPIFYARIDSGPWASFTLIAGNPEFIIATGLDDRKHFLETVIATAIGSTFTTRWTQTNAFNLSGIRLDSGKLLYAPVRRTKNIIIYGDSITEGVFTHGEDLPADAVASYGYELSQAIDAEVGIVGFAGQGVNAGYGNVPALTSSYNFIYSGAARSFSPAPDLVIYNEGTNDVGSISAGLVTVAQGIISASPTSKQVILVPFNQSHATEVAAAASTVANANVTSHSTSGWWNTDDSPDNLHPYDYSHVGLIAPKLIPVAAGLLYQSSVSRPFIVIN